MFTGLVEELGTVIAVERRSDACRLTIAATTVLDDAVPGASIAVNGCCLTVTELTLPDGDRPGTWSADLMAQTLDLTSLGALEPGDRVNLERAVRADQRLGGHIVQGHVDAVGTVRTRTPGDHWEVVEISLPPSLSRFLVDQGSITVDGTSLTVVSPGDDSFTVSLIPETLARTTLGLRRPGDPVNLEVDVLAKYVDRLLRHRPTQDTAAQETP